MRRLPLFSALLLGASPAWGAGYSVDIELLRPGFSDGSVPGVDSPLMRPRGAWTMGLLGQREVDPLVLYDDSATVAGIGEPLLIVGQRDTAHLGLAWSFTERADARLVLPLANQGEGAAPDLAADGFGIGDLGAAARFQLLQRGPFTGGLRTDVVLNIGKRQAWLGERSLRTGGAALAMVQVGPIDLLLDTGVQVRTRVETEEDFALGSELFLNAAVRGNFIDDRLGTYVGLLGRGGISSLADGGAENPVEAIAGVHGQVIKHLRADLGLGTGLTDGYGTTAQRIFLGLTWVQLPRPPKPAPIVIVEELPDVPDLAPEVDIEELIKVPDWGEGELARVIDTKIVIRDPIQFEFGTPRILPPSIPTLRAVALLLRSNDRILHLVVEGHASEEGTYTYNYELSRERARAVWEQLVLANVHPDRVSYRGMGEVEPIAEGSDETALALNRRVEFHIVHQLGPLDLAPKLSKSVKLPWSGVGATISPPPPGQVGDGDDKAGDPTDPGAPDEPSADEEEAPAIETGSSETGSSETGSSETGSSATGNSETGNSETGNEEVAP